MLLSGNIPGRNFSNQGELLYRRWVLFFSNFSISSLFATGFLPASCALRDYTSRGVLQDDKLESRLNTIFRCFLRLCGFPEICSSSCYDSFSFFVCATTIVSHCFLDPKRSLSPWAPSSLICCYVLAVVNPPTWMNFCLPSHLLQIHCACASFDYLGWWSWVHILLRANLGILE
jgi:hypothetical protein